MTETEKFILQKEAHIQDAARGMYRAPLSERTRATAAADRSAARDFARCCFTTGVVCPLVGETTELTLHIPMYHGRPPLPQRPPAVVRVRVMHHGDSTSAPEFERTYDASGVTTGGSGAALLLSQNMIPTVPTMRLRYGPIKKAGPFLLAIEVDGAHVMGSPFSLHCRPGAAIANKSSLDAAADSVRAGEPADQMLMNVDEDEEVVFDLWDEPLPATPAPRKTASFAKRSAAEKAAAEEALVSSMKAAAAKKKARGKPPPPPPRRLRFGLAAAAPEKAAASSFAKVPIDAPTSSSSPDLGKEIGQAVSFVFVETPVALFKSSAELINRVDDELRLTHDARWDDPRERSDEINMKSIRMMWKTFFN